MKEADERADEKTGEKRTSEIYRLRNVNLALALDTAFFYFGDLYQRYLTWWAREKLKPPGTLLDLGCDCGALTCFYACLYPETEVWGIDANPLAVARAKELKQRLGLSNIHFDVCDVREIGDRFEAHKFGIITSVNVIHEVCEFPTDDRAWALDDVDLEYGTEGARRILQNLRGLLNDESGRYISCERVSALPVCARWMRSMNQVGLHINWQASFMLYNRSTLQDQERFPVFVTQPASDTDSQSLERILAFDAYPEYADKADRLMLEGSAAETLFRAFAEKHRIIGVEIEYNNGSGTSRSELWQAGSVLLAYNYTTRWYRRLVIHSVAVKQEYLAILLQAGVGQEKHGNVRVACEGADYQPGKIEISSEGELRILTLTRES